MWLGGSSIELHDPLAQVGIDHFDAVPFQERIEMALLGEHRLAFHELLHAVPLQDTEHDLVVLRRIASPVHLTARALLLALRTAPNTRASRDAVWALIAEAVSRSVSHSGSD